MNPATPATPDSMAAYYAQRAAYYERVYFKPERQADLRAMEAALAAPDSPFAGRSVLELACGTGWWTPHGAARARHWRATDLNPETLAVALAKPGMPACVQWQTVDAYTLAGLDDAVFDAAFTGCWWSHVPLQRLPAWLAGLHARLAPGARVVMLDNRYVHGNSTPISRQDQAGNGYQLRTLDDGSQHEVLKNFPTADQAAALLQAAAALQGGTVTALHWHEHTHYWVLSYTLGDQAMAR